MNDSWPAIEARLVSVTNEIHFSRANAIVVAKQVGIPAARQEMDVSTKRVFLSSLFDLVATMAQCSQDFIASRFKNDVFPLLSKLLGDFAGDLSPSETSHDDSCRPIRDVGVQPQSHPRQASEAALIVSILNCLAGVFRQPKCGRALADLIPTASTLILPFLGDRAETGNACMSAIKEMVQIDCDATWRPLVLLSGKQFPPPKPWGSAGEVKRPIALVAAAENEAPPPSLLAQRASDLVAFVETLPEQPLY